MKYVIFQQTDGFKFALLFPEHVDHGRCVYGLKQVVQGATVVGAGFCSVTLSEGKVKVGTHGHSNSLKLYANDADLAVIKPMFDKLCNYVLFETPSSNWEPCVFALDVNSQFVIQGLKTTHPGIKPIRGGQLSVSIENEKLIVRNAGQLEGLKSSEDENWDLNRMIVGSNRY